MPGILNVDGKNVKPVIAAWPSGWWDANIDPGLNPVQVVARVEELTASLHPALDQLRQIARAYEAAQRKRALVGEPAPYRCAKCWDTGWIELTHAGRGLVKECGCKPLVRPSPGEATKPRKVER